MPKKIKELSVMLKKQICKNSRNLIFMFPDKDGRFGEFGGRFVFQETLMPLLLEVEKEYQKAKKSKKFKDEVKYYFNNYIGRPSHFILLNVYQKNKRSQNLF